MANNDQRMTGTEEETDAEKLITTDVTASLSREQTARTEESTPVIEARDVDTARSRRSTVSRWTFPRGG